jgi:serine protease AprX
MLAGAMGALRTRRRCALLAVTIAGATFATPSFVARGTSAAYVEPALFDSRGVVRVVVQASSSAKARAAVAHAHGVLTRELTIVNGVAANVRVDELAHIASEVGVRAITQDARVTVAGGGDNNNGSSPPTATPALRNVFAEESGVAAMRKANKADGSGVTVALIDTGVRDSTDLAGRVLAVTDDRTGTTAPCMNMSGESTCDDSYGHGTFVAGLIAGNGAASGGAITGVATKANLLSVKIAGADGAADVSNVLAAIQWVVSFRDRYRVRILNLSLGTDSTQSYRVDPLNYAVERAWDAGIVVVVSASNRGPAGGTISKPGDDPFVITVGAIDDVGTTDKADDRLPDFTGRGPTAADGLSKPDIMAAGAHVLSLNATGSSIATQFPTSVPDFGGAYRKGSGTSMAAGIVSGAIAMLVQRQPTITPDRVKYVLANSAIGVASDDVNATGDGLLNINGAAQFTAPGLANEGVVRSNGMGALDASRGNVGMIAADPARTLLGGSIQTAQLVAWDPAAFVSGDWTSTGWYGSSWYGSSWYGSSWYGSTWDAGSWMGSSWYGTVDGSSWYGSSWYGSSWYGAWS